MKFTLSDEFLGKLKTLRHDYEQRTGVDLKGSQPFLISCYLGAKDLKTRNKQITFIEQWLEALQEDLNHSCVILSEKSKSAKSQEITLTTHMPTAKDIETQMTALRVLFMADLYIKSQIKSKYKVRSGNSAILIQLLNEAAGVTASNTIDHDTRACCIQATQHYLTEKGRLEEINSKLKTKFSPHNWNNFLDYIDHEASKLDEADKTHYPATALMMPLMGLPLQLAGYTTGYIVGEMIAKSTEMLKTKQALTVALGSGLFLVFGPSAQLGIMMLVPTYAERIVNTFCGVSTAWLFGAAGHLVGNGLGLGVGLSVDLSWKLMYYSFTLLAGLYTKSKNQTNINGISLINGHRVENGVELNYIDLNKLPPNYKFFPVDFTVKSDELVISINGQTTAVPWDQGQQPEEYIQKLKLLFDQSIKQEMQQVVKIEEINNEELPLHPAVIIPRSDADLIKSMQISKDDETIVTYLSNLVQDSDESLHSKESNDNSVEASQHAKESLEDPITTCSL